MLRTAPRGAFGFDGHGLLARSPIRVCGNSSGPPAVSVPALVRMNGMCAAGTGGSPSR
ncbi:MAG: hypothetical protein JOZ65_25810 [Chloroflexi bacterium]|nr:hypothetical protein [Chloroflexota bacterium]